MDVSSQEVEIQNSGYGHGHGHGHGSPIVAVPHNNNMINNGTHTSNVEEEEEQQQQHEVVPYKKQQQQVVRYRECLKNHAASMGGSATDGCGEFMPSGEEGSIEALNCSACNCHRNFHRKEIEGQFFIQQHPSLCHETFYNNNNPLLNRVGRKVILGHHPNNNNNNNNNKTSSPDHTLGYPTRLPHQMILPYNFGLGGGGGGGGSLPSESDEQDQDVNCVGHVAMARPPPPPLPNQHHHHQLVKKRFRTKFSQEQKDKMLEFAEKVGWKIQKQEDCVVQQLCQEIGVRRRVLKVWMHNNKHNLARNNHIHMDPPPTTTTTTTTTIIPQHHPN